MEFYILGIFFRNFFSKYVEEIQVKIQIRQIAGILHEDQYTFLIISRSVLLMNGKYLRQIL